MSRGTLARLSLWLVDVFLRVADWSTERMS